MLYFFIISVQGIMENIAVEQIKTSKGFIHCSFINHLKDRTLIFLHGNSSSGSFWDPLTESSLQEHFNFLTFDLPGHGHSPVPENPEETYNLPAYANLLAEIISYFGLKEYFLVGHSLGGHIILESLEEISGCKGVLIMGTPPLTHPPQMEKAFKMSPQFLSFIQSGTDRAVMEATFKSMFPEDKTHLAGFLYEDYFKTDPQARDLLTESISKGKFKDELKILQGTKIPVYLVVSDHDQMVNPEYFSHFLPAYEVINIPAAGHYAPLEKHEAFVRYIFEKFVA